MPASSKASSGCSHSSLLPVLSGFLLPSGCHGGFCQCQLLASSPATTWACRNPGSLRGTWGCTLRAWQAFQSIVQECTPVPGHAADEHRDSSECYSVAQLQNTSKATQNQANAPFLVGKAKPNNVDLSKDKSMEEM